MSLLYLSLGSNLKDRYANLRAALDELQKHARITAVSPVYSTEPWGDSEQSSFLNICATATTHHSPHEFLDHVKEIEREMGRVVTRHWGPRLIDIDILFYDHLVMSDERLTIPHPYIAERAFVLAPLADLAPEFKHPQTGLTVRQMLEQVDTDGVERLFEMPLPAQPRDQSEVAP